MKKFEKLVKNSIGLYDKLVNSHPTLARGKVWCISCGKTKKVDSVECFRSGWPTCCGYTMTLDSPKERKQYKGK